MKAILLVSSLMAMTAGAIPTVTDVSMTLNDLGNVATVEYVLSGGPAVVTVDVQTNGVPLGDGLGRMTGDWNGPMQNGRHRMKWRPSKRLYAQGIESIDAKAIVTAWSAVKGPDFLVCDLSGREPPRYYADEAHLPGGVSNDLYKTTSLLMKFIPAANVSWYMGAPSNEVGMIGWDLANNKQVVGNYCGESFHRVTLTKGYYLGVYEVTQRQYELVTGKRPSYFKNDQFYEMRPVENVAYSDLRGNTWPGGGRIDCGSAAIKGFRDRTGLMLDLPTEAQWEFACRAGMTTPYNNGKWPAYSGEAAGTGNETALEDVKGLDDIARYAHSSGMTASGNSYAYPSADCSPDFGTAIVGTYAPNAFGLYDMHGNVSEWCLDCAGPWLGVEPVVDPVGCSFAQSYASCTHILRGGSLYHGGRMCRAAARRFQAIGGQPWFGFRLCLTLD